jgi:4-hydroxy-tetrahydrodipicolinate synthase
VTSHDRLRAAIAGVGVTPVTPFTRDLATVDLHAFSANLSFLVEEGVTLFYPAGNTGEASSLSPDEWSTVVATAVEASNGRAVVVPGIGHELPVAIEMAGRAERLGADGLLLMPRQQPYAAGSGLTEYWRRLLERTSLPVVLYKRGLPEDRELLEAADHSSVVGCKYGGKDVSAFATVVSADHSTTVWTCGVAERYAPFFHVAGARGFTSGLANFAPRLALHMHAALADGDMATALELRSIALPFEELRARHGDAFNVSAVKAAMDDSGLAGGEVRPPLRPLDPASRSEIPTMVEAMRS